MLMNYKDIIVFALYNRISINYITLQKISVVKSILFINILLQFITEYVIKIYPLLIVFKNYMYINVCNISKRKFVKLMLKFKLINNPIICNSLF